MIIFMVLSSWLRTIARVYPIHLMNPLSVRWLPTLRPSQTTYAVSPSVSCYHPRPPSSFYYYSAGKLKVTLPSVEGGRQPVPKAVYCSVVIINTTTCDEIRA